MRDAPLAKSGVMSGDQKQRDEAREAAGWPKGARHELVSLTLLQQSPLWREAAHDWELVQHLVASHHGWCRPLAPAVQDDTPPAPEIAWEGQTFEVGHDPRWARLDSGIAERFWLLVRRYGWYGLAWLEASVRLSDQRRSREEMRGGEA